VGCGAEGVHASAMHGIGDRAARTCCSPSACCSSSPAELAARARTPSQSAGRATLSGGGRPEPTESSPPLRQAARWLAPAWPGAAAAPTRGCPPDALGALVLRQRLLVLPASRRTARSVRPARRGAGERGVYEQARAHRHLAREHRRSARCAANAWSTPRTSTFASAPAIPLSIHARAPAIHARRASPAGWGSSANIATGPSLRQAAATTAGCRLSAHAPPPPPSSCGQVGVGQGPARPPRRARRRRAAPRMAVVRETCRSARWPAPSTR